jgi:hypothetical protein
VADAADPAGRPDEIVWRGDLDDDCSAEWRGLGAHAELMGESDPSDPDSADAWYCSVWRVNPAARVGSDNETLFHSSDHDTLPLTGPAARRLCELVMRAEAYREDRDRSRAALAAAADALLPLLKDPRVMRAVADDCGGEVATCRCAYCSACRAEGAARAALGG